MLTAGIDLGARTLKIVVVQGGEMIDKVLVPAGADAGAALEGAFSRLQTKPGRIERLAATGIGRRGVARATGFVSEAAAAAKAGASLFPGARTVIEVGAEEGRAVKLDAAGRMVDFAVNEKCAAGAGSFAEAMARALEVSLEELGEMSLRASGKVAMNAQCVVFAESELVALLHANTPKEDIAKAIHEAISARIGSMVRQLGMQEKVVLIGGLARNQGFVQSLNRELATEVLVPEEPEFAGALGAALLAAEGDYSDQPAGDA